MRKTLLIAVLLGGVVAWGLFAQAYTVNYMDGTVEMQTAKGWKALSIGDQVPADSTLRISQTGSLELTRARTKVTLLKDGVYPLANLTQQAGKSGGGVGNSIAQKLQTMVTEKPKASAAGGVRGAAQGSGTVTWVDESDETRARAQALLDKGQFGEAAKLLSDALNDSASEADVPEFTYMLGLAYYDAGQTARAYRALSRVTPQTDAPWYARYVILKAQVLVDTSNFNEALSILAPFISTYPRGEPTQVAYLLSGLCQSGLGDRGAALAAFDAGYQLDPSTDTARLIDQQRKAK